MTEAIHAHTWLGFCLWNDALETSSPRVHGGQNAKHWTVVRDPLPVEEGGFRPGAQFESKEFPVMLQLGYLGYGAKVERDGKVYTVQPGATLIDEQGQAWEFIVSQSRLVRIYERRARV